MVDEDARAAPRSRISRRRVLGAGAALALSGTAVLVGADWRGASRNASPTAASRGGAVAALGYARGSATALGADTGAPGDLVPASALASGEAELEDHGARIQIWLPGDDGLGLEHAPVGPIRRLPGGVPGHALPCLELRGACCALPRLAGHFPRPNTSNLLLEVQTAGRSGVMRTTTLGFTLDREPAVANLRRGIYVIALRAPDDRPISVWSRCGLQCASILEGHETPISATGALRRLPHLLMPLDHAPSDPTPSPRAVGRRTEPRHAPQGAPGDEAFLYRVYGAPARKSWRLPLERRAEACLPHVAVRGPARVLSNRLRRREFRRDSRRRPPDRAALRGPPPRRDPPDRHRAGCRRIAAEESGPN